VIAAANNPSTRELSKSLQLPAIEFLLVSYCNSNHIFSFSSNMRIGAHPYDFAGGEWSQE